jgi:hypothetical protein
VTVISIHPMRIQKHAVDESEALVPVVLLDDAELNQLLWRGTPSS